MTGDDDRALATLPEPRGAAAIAAAGPTPYRIAFVCLGNICRSPTAAVVMAQKLTDAGLSQTIGVASAGTGDWHLGEQMDRRAAATLTAHGYDPSEHRATQFDASWFDQHDLVLVMDQLNARDVQAMARDESDTSRIMMFRTFDPLVEDTLDVPDPWYSGDDSFAAVLAMVERTCDALVDALTARLEANGPDGR
ncbi:MAG: low molecular weight protein-tyrosine-phosphatase [Nocardioidaceae bacterium]